MTRLAIVGARGLARRLPALMWLTLVWVLLWGTWTWGTAVAGLLAASVVTAVLPLPVVVLGGRLHPWGVLRFAALLGRDLVVSSAQVAWVAVVHGPRVRNAIVAVRLRSRSDLVMTITAETLSLVPGSLVIEVVRSRRMLYAHALDVRTPEGVEAFRQHVLEVEARVIRAVGDKRSIRELGRERQRERQGGSP